MITHNASMQDHTVIDVLGGGTKVVEALEREFPQLRKIGPHAVYRWKQHGIPQGWRFWVCQLAQRQMPDFDVARFMGLPSAQKPVKTRRTKIAA